MLDFSTLQQEVSHGTPGRPDLLSLKTTSMSIGVTTCSRHYLTHLLLGGAILTAMGEMDFVESSIVGLEAGETAMEIYIESFKHLATINCPDVY